MSPASASMSPDCPGLAATVSPVMISFITSSWRPSQSPTGFALVEAFIDEGLEPWAISPRLGSNAVTTWTTPMMKQSAPGKIDQSLHLDILTAATRETAMTRLEKQFKNMSMSGVSHKPSWWLRRTARSSQLESCGRTRRTARGLGCETVVVYLAELERCVTPASHWSSAPHP